MTNLETIIAEKVHALPIEKQQLVLNSIEEIEREDVVLNGNESVEKTPETRNSEDKRNARLKLIGMFKSGKSDTSIRAEEILFEEVDRKSGFTVKK